MTAKRILVIDDEDDIREVVQMGLEAVAGWEVLTASSGYDGLRKAALEQPDAILLDVMMPDMDGVTTFRELQGSSSTRHIPVILLTAKLQPTDQRRFAELGTEGLMAKPFDPLGLAGQIVQCLGWKVESLSASP